MAGPAPGPASTDEDQEGEESTSSSPEEVVEGIQDHLLDALVHPNLP